MNELRLKTPAPREAHPPSDEPALDLCAQVRRSCAELASEARWVRIDGDALERAADAWSVGGPATEPQELDPEIHYVDGVAEDVAAYVIVLDAINFGSGWFPTLRKRPGLSGYSTIASALKDKFHKDGPWAAHELRAIDAASLARVLGQPQGHQLMALYAEALRDLGSFLRARRPIDLIDEAGRSAVRFAESLREMPYFEDAGLWKRAQITANDLALAGLADFDDLDRLTIFADNLVPHVLRVDGILVYDEALAHHIDSAQLLEPGRQEREIRACAVHACEQLAERLGVPPRVLDVWLWNRGQGPGYKSRPRHRTRTVYY